jgi:hypothetical protein
VTRIYVDPDAARIDGGDEPSADPDSLRSLGFLVEAGHELVVVIAPEAELPADLRAVASARTASIPDSPAAGAWYLTRDIEHCRGKSARVRTVLIGAAPPSGSIHRCDAVARDVQAAVMEILAAEAMP